MRAQSLTPGAKTCCPAPAVHPFLCRRLDYLHIMTKLPTLTCMQAYASTAACYAIHQAKSANCSSAGSMPAVACIAVSRKDSGS